VKPIAAHPSLHRNYGELGVDVVFGIEHLRQLPESHSMPYRYGAVIGKVLAPGLGHGPLDHRAHQRIGSVQYENGDACFRRRFEEVSERRLISVETNPSVLNVNGDRI